MIHRCCALLLSLATSVPAAAAPPDPPREKARLDHYGDPLPDTRSR
jgi:hypothetical protein